MPVFIRKTRGIIYILTISKISLTANCADDSKVLREETIRIIRRKNILKTMLTKKVATSTKIVADDDELEIGKLSEQEAAWANEVEQMKTHF